MIARAGSGWQTVLADLSLILFMTTAAALSQADDRAPSAPAAPSQRAEPLALWRQAPGSPDMADWLALQAPDTRAQLTILAPYQPGGQEKALAEAGALARLAERQGLKPRIVVEPGAGSIGATLAYDDPAATLARDLRREATDPSQENSR